MKYAHNTFSEDDHSEEDSHSIKNRASYIRSRSYSALRRRRSNGGRTGDLQINGRRRRRWSW